MRFFVAKDAPQNDGGFCSGRNLRWRFALVTLAVWAAADKRCRATALKNELGKKEILRRPPQAGSSG